MLSVGEAMLFSLLLGALLAGIYIVFAYVRMLLGGGCPASLCKMPEVICLPILKERKTFPKEKGRKQVYSKILTFLLDVLYFFLCGTALSVFVYSVGGIFRISYVTLSVIGFALFRVTLGGLCLSASPWVLLGIKIFLWYAIYFLGLPFRFLFSVTKFVFLKLRLIFLSVCAKIKKELYDRKEKRSEDAFGKEWEQKIREEITRSLL